jgi:apolipoprotein D and lipocalin family protein
MRYLLFLALAFAAIVALAASAKAKAPPLASQADVDLKRYMGRWWVIANIPYWAENGKLASADVYALRPDGKIDNVFVYRKQFGQAEKRLNAVATVQPGTRNTHWKIAFLGGLLRADYLVLEVAPDYSWALIGQPSRKLAWVFAREQRMDDARLAQLSARFAKYGYDPAKLKRVRQFPDQ